VADHRLAAPFAHKPDKQALAAALQGGWEPVPDLLVELVARRPAGQRILGFAAHSGDVLPQAQAKFARKGCDLLFANPIDRPGVGFGTAANEGWLLGPGASVSRMEPMGKLALAHQLLTALRPPGPCPPRRSAADP
jgi:phosphopantothenoylcysteine decarboxylase/phosphopantothenate--cysteine ligase